MRFPDQATTKGHHPRDSCVYGERGVGASFHLFQFGILSFYSRSITRVAERAYVFLNPSVTTATRPLIFDRAHIKMTRRSLRNLWQVLMKCIHDRNYRSSSLPTFHARRSARANPLEKKGEKPADFVTIRVEKERFAAPNAAYTFLTSRGFPLCEPVAFAMRFNGSLLLEIITEQPVSRGSFSHF